MLEGIADYRIIQWCNYKISAKIIARMCFLCNYHLKQRETFWVSISGVSICVEMGNYVAVLEEFQIHTYEYMGISNLDPATVMIIIYLVGGQYRKIETIRIQQ